MPSFYFIVKTTAPVFRTTLPAGAIAVVDCEFLAQWAAALPDNTLASVPNVFVSPDICQILKVVPQGVGVTHIIYDTPEQLLDWLTSFDPTWVHSAALEHITEEEYNG